MHVGGEARSYARARELLVHALGHSPSAKTIERLVNQIGPELAARQQQEQHEQEVVAPDVAVVSCDGGRIHTREPGHGPGVHGAKWRETKNAAFERMTADAASESDPCPALPQTFRAVAHVAKIAEQPAFEAKRTEQAEAESSSARYVGPKRILRTCISSLVNSEEFGVQMLREARRRKFHEGGRRVFIGDGLPWNWSIQREHFADFTPILDFIHAVHYLYSAAAAWESDDERRWARYLELAEAVWQGRVGEVIERLRGELASRGVTASELPDESPYQPLATAARYLENNRERMDYPRYRREGLPITSAPMESLIKQINLRVKGTEMTWNDPTGAEAILQLRSASLCEDGRLDAYLRRRPGCPWARRSTLANAA